MSPGHSLVVPRRLISSWWELAADERIDIWSLVDEVKALLDARHAPDGYNVGFNAGAAAGQTVEHLHVHVIPRFDGDVADPRGGIRWVVPEKANYLAPPSELPRATPLQLVDSVDDRILKLELLRCLINEDFDRVDLLVSFIMRSGVELVEQRLKGAIDRGAEIRVLTTDYLFVTHPDAIVRLRDLGRAAEINERGGRIAASCVPGPTHELPSEGVPVLVGGERFSRGGSNRPIPGSAPNRSSCSGVAIPAPGRRAPSSEASTACR